MPIVGAKIGPIKRDNWTRPITKEGLIRPAAGADSQILPAEGTMPMLCPSDQETEIEIESIAFGFVLVARILTKFFTHIPKTFSRIVDVRQIVQLRDKRHGERSERDHQFESDRHREPSRVVHGIQPIKVDGCIWHDLCGRWGDAKGVVVVAVYL
jgi:hypothetical protein